jgi:hypothetical protein
MTPEQALAVLVQIYEQTRLLPADHRKANAAIIVLRNAIAPPEPAPVPTELAIAPPPAEPDNTED